jgi:hypothetical protein
MSENTPNNRKPFTPPHIVVPRLAWVALGPVALLITAMVLVTNGGGWLSLSSIAFLVTIPVMVAGRFIEQKSGFGLDSTGEPATWAGFRTYVLIMVPVLVGVWIVLNVIGGIVK